MRSSSEELRLQAAILSERLENKTFQDTHSSRWDRLIGVGVATLIGVLVGLGLKVLRG